ncbi:hypothetical protein Bca52824_029120 [Brassica carinata]|uniref:Uncharacterized protein n=1 Tax=Brassica carinata TaxID=52824 RepID=A0A8X8ASJ0_BRACI|nr:hypothetical protein Bca52824_029120 [Brassica carinata]
MVDTDWKSKMMSSESPKLFEAPRHYPSAVQSRRLISHLVLRTSSLLRLRALPPSPRAQNPLVISRFPSLIGSIRLLRHETVHQPPRVEPTVDSLVTNQIQLIASICEEEEDEDEADQDQVSEGRSSLSLLPHLATWRKTESLGKKILRTIDNEMRRCKYTLGLGEQNISNKPNLRYDAVCKPDEVHGLKDNPYADHVDNYENQTLYILHQILESFKDVYLVERIWKLMTEIEDLYVLMDPEDFLKLKRQLWIESTGKNDAFCFRSRGLVEMTRMSKDLRQKIPKILEVEVDPTGGPRLQEAAMKLYARKGGECDKIHLLQGMQAVEIAAKSFFFAYKQLVAVMMGSAATATGSQVSSCDSLSQIFMEPTYFPSLDAAKTFLGEFWGNLG